MSREWLNFENRFVRATAREQGSLEKRSVRESVDLECGAYKCDVQQFEK